MDDKVQSQVFNFIIHVLIRLSSTLNNNCTMFFSSYSEFLESDQETAVYCSPSRDLRLSDAQYLSALAAQHDLVYSEFTSIISKRLITLPYPTSFQNCNPFCPLCLRFVDSVTPFTTCYINDQRNYLIHQQCLEREKGYELRNVGEIVVSEIKVESSSICKKQKAVLGKDSREFYIQIALTHPINDKNFIKLSQKVPLIKDHFQIVMKEEETNSYFPNVIMLPETDYHLTINLYEVGNKGNQAKMTKYFTFKHLRGMRRAVICCQEVKMEVQLIDDLEEKRRLTDVMNYKCRNSTDQVSFVRIHAFQISLPQQLEDSDQGFMIGSGSTIVEDLLNEKENSISTIRTSEPSPVKNSKLLTDSNSSNEAQSEKVNLSKLISTNTLIEFVKSNTHSRHFQNYLSECSQREIAEIIRHVKEKMVELTTHEYGNYMVQKLYTVCSPSQRLELLQVILPQLCELAKNKQGTHTIQAFLGCFTLNEEYSLVSMQIMQEYYALCCHNNATHFIQKIIKTFPLDFTIGYFHYITENLMAFALDKNAMCVVKHMMRRLRQMQGKQEIYDQAIDLVRRQLIFNVTFNVDRLISDCYGNYVIQFCFELFDLEKCAGITERILSRFSHYAIDKYSSNVLIKCISTYWTDRRVYFSLRGLSSTQILELFRSKDGNKILLELMEKLEGTELWDRLYAVLVQIEPTKYYHDRWGVCLGSRSGQVGTRLTAFPEATRKHYNKKY